MRAHSYTMAMAALCSLALAVAASPDPAAPRTLAEWMQQEHRFLRRYQAIVEQAAHDHRYGYATPALLMPTAIDLYIGYVAVLHDTEQRFFYPVLHAHMTPEQQRALHLVEADGLEEVDTVRYWQRGLTQVEAGQKTMKEVAETIEYVGRMVNRHIVLQEERAWPYLDGIPAKEQAAVLAQILAFERQAIGTDGPGRYERLLTAIEEEIKAFNGRKW